MILLKSETDLIKMRKAGLILAGIMKKVIGSVRAGMSTRDIDNLTRELIRRENAEPAFLGYNGYPASICVSINEEVVHGIPGERLIEESDIVSLDLGIKFQGFFSDCTETVAVGKVAPRVRKLIDVTRQSLNEGIKAALPGNRLGDIAGAVQGYVEKNGFSVVRQFVGHGIGRSLHEEPEVPNFGRTGRGTVLEPGMVLAIEPMVNMGTWECVVLDDGWTAVTADKKPSAHFEHTVAICKNGPEILTRL